MEEQIKKLERVYKEFGMIFNTDYPGMVDLKDTINQLEVLNRENVLVTNHDAKRTMFLKKEQRPDISKVMKKMLVNRVIEKVTEVFSTSLVEIKSKSKEHEVVCARHMLTYVLRYELRLKTREVGDVVNKDHSTISNACNKIVPDLLEQDNFFLIKKGIIYRDLNLPFKSKVKSYYL